MNTGHASAPEEQRRPHPRAVKNANLSKDGAWRSFPNVPNLLQYVSTGTYYGRIKSAGKAIRRSLKTDVFKTAKLRLADFIKENLTRAGVPGDVPTFAQAKELFLKDLEANPAYKAKTKEYKLFNLSHIEKHWPSLGNLRLDEITEAQCQQWAKLAAEALSPEAYNHTLGVFRDILKRGAREYKAKGGQEILDPSRGFQTDSGVEHLLPGRSAFHGILRIPHLWHPARHLPLPTTGLTSYLKTALRRTQNHGTLGLCKRLENFLWCLAI